MLRNEQSKQSQQLNTNSTFQISSIGNASSKRTGSASSMSVDLDNDFEIEPCSHHPGYLENKFCKQCEESICIRCVKYSHIDHEIVSMEQKIQEEYTRVKNFLHSGKRDSEEAQKKVEEMSKKIEKIEASTSEATERMTSQFEYVKHELHTIYQLEVEQINEKKFKDTQKLKDNKNELQQFVKSWKDTEERGQNILKQGGASNFVSETTGFLESAPKEQKFLEKQIREIDYTEPIYKQGVGGEIFQTFLREHVLGSFVRYPRDSVPSIGTRAQLVAYTDVKKHESRLKTFSSAVLKGDSLWVCGWVKGRFWYNDYMALFNVDIPEYNFLLKQKIKDSPAGQPIIVSVFNKSVLFAKQTGRDLYCFDTETEQVSTLNPGNVTVMAMCGDAACVYILDNSHPHRINIFDSDSKLIGNLETGLEGIMNCDDVDMCVINGDEITTGHRKSTANNIVIISASFPQASVRGISQMGGGILWQMDYRTCPDLDLNFNPCSVSVSNSGDMFIADKEAEKVNTN